MDFVKFTGKTVDDALTNALLELKAASDQIEYEVVDSGSAGIFGLGSRPAVINVRKKFTIDGAAKDFLEDVFRTMDMDVDIEIDYNEEEKEISVELIGDDMGILIGKRGQTLDSLQYLTSLVVNKQSEEYIRVKLDIENYRERRQETLENLARNLARKVKRTRKPAVLEPMNPYERRIIHSTLQNDRYVVTSSEGEEPYRHVVISLKRERNDRQGRYSRSDY